MKETIVVPELGSTDKLEVNDVSIAVGDVITEGDTIFSLEGDKSSIDIPSPISGTVVEILAKVGDKLGEGENLAIVEVTGASAEAAPAAASVEATAPVVDAATSSAIETVYTPQIDGELKVTGISVNVGDTIAVDQELLTLEGDKASVEVPSPIEGVVTEILVKIDDSIEAGHPIFKFEVKSAVAAAVAVSPATSVAAPAEKVQKAASAPVASGSKLGFEEVSKANAYTHATPLVRSLARIYGVNLDLVKGTGNKARITRDDLTNYIKNAVQSHTSGSSAGAGVNGLNLLPWPKIDFSKFGEIEEKELSKIQKISGANLHRNWVHIPHVTQWDKADITDLESFRKEQNVLAEKRKLDVKITPLVFILKALGKALEEFPKFNASLSEDASKLILKKYINIGVAVDTPNGLVVPVFKDVNKKSIIELSRELAVISKKARDGKLTGADMSGGCMTISSLGGIGGTHFTPIVNAPEVAILGVSKSEFAPVWNGKEFAPRLMLPLSLSYDHRAIDGADGARFITYVSSLLSDLRNLIM